MTMRRLRGLHLIVLALAKLEPANSEPVPFRGNWQRRRCWAGNLNFELGVYLPGTKIKTSPTDYAPLEQLQMMRFKRESWELFGPIRAAKNPEIFFPLPFGRGKICGNWKFIVVPLATLLPC
jgi:hypothetical protein